LDVLGAGNSEGPREFICNGTGTVLEKLLQLPTGEAASGSGPLLLGHQPAAAAARKQKRKQLNPFQHLQQHWHWYQPLYTSSDLGSNSLLLKAS
jgi:hypothetical protein